MLPRIFPALLAAVFFLGGCDQKKTSDNRPRPTPAPTGQPPLELVFTYGSEKEDWIKAVTEEFHRQSPKTAAGQPIRITAIAQGSGDCIDEAINGAPRQPHLTSPASGAYITLGNARWRSRSGGRDLVSKTENLVLSPVVVAMWKPMATAMGWPAKPIGWADILALSQNPQGWASVGQAQWGRFKFGHTHPEFSNSGLIAVLAEAYAATGKRDGLTLADLQTDKTAKFVTGIEQAVVHYGTSTGFFARKMFGNGPSYLSAAVVYENNVIEANDPKRYPDLSLPVVSIYPREGTFWADHPIGVVEREWTTEAHREAARKYIEFLLARPQQQRAVELGFRPASLEVPVAAPIDAAHGVDPKEPQTTLAVPPADVLDGALALWKTNKKSSGIVLTLDISGSMKGARIKNARLGAAQLVANLGDRDNFSLLAFDERLDWLFQGVPLAVGRKKAEDVIGGLVERGGTALYDAIAESYRYQSGRQKAEPNRIHAVIVLTDGEDNQSKTSLADLLKLVKFDSERAPVRIFTIGYGEEASEKILKQIADSTQGRFYKGTPENITTVFRDIATFF